MGYRKHIAVLLLLGVALLGIVWRWLSLEGWLSTEMLAQQLSAVREWHGNPLLIPGVMMFFSVLLLTLFPLTILVALCGLLFGPQWGLFYATLGTLSSSVVSYFVGRGLGQNWLHRHGGRRLRIASRYLGERGIRTMTVINLLPLAPFTVTNMLAGASHIRFRDYLIGSTLGIVPGLAVVTLLGSQIGALLTATDKQDIALALGGVALCLLAWRLIRSRSKRLERSLNAAEPTDRRRSHESDEQNN